MKTNSLRLLFAVFACIFIGVCGMSAAGKLEDVREEVLPLPRPIPQDQVTDAPVEGAVASWGPLFKWQRDNVDREVISYEPIIKNKMLTDWRVVSAKAKTFNPTSFGYLASGRPFFLPEGMSQADVLKEVWSRSAKKIERANKPNPGAINSVKQDDGRVVIYGVWYSYKNPNASLVNGRIKFTNPFDSFEEKLAFEARKASLAMQVPEVVAKNPERYIVDYHATSDGDVVVMKPFEVKGDKLWGNWEFHYATKRSEPASDGSVQLTRVSDYVTVTSVDPVSPAAQFGFKSGMYVWSLNGVSTVGLGSSEEFKRLVGQVSSGNMRLEVSDSLKGEHYFITIPMDKFEAARNKVPTIAALP